MKVRLGYVCLALKLNGVTASSPVTFKTYNNIISKDEKLNKLKKVTSSNLYDLKKILKYNIENNFHFYRITSKLVPLANHPEVSNWDYRKLFSIDFAEIGEIIRDSNMRVDTHPDQFNVINSTKPNVIENTKSNLMTHVHLFEDINYPEGKMVLHIGSGAGGKEAAVDRFINNFNSFPKEITSRLILENDDKTFTAKDVLNICNELHVPMVLDIHHHNIKNDDENIVELLPHIIDTWKDTNLNPKMHFSSPKDTPLDRKHADYINPNEFIKFIDTLKIFNTDIDIMLECKKKDLALLELVIDLKKLKPEYKWIDKSTFIV